MSSYNITQQIFDIIFAYMKVYGLIDEGWSIKVTNSLSTLGCCDHDMKVISISKKTYYLENELEDTILHEIAHAIAGYKNKHNKTWKLIAKSIGCSGKITCSV